MGNFVRTLSDRACVVASDSTWMEDAAIAQLLTTSQLEGMRRVAGMPDLHPGRGYPVGAAFFSVGHFYPALVGNDIGCGMAAVRTTLRANDLPDDLRQLRNSIERSIPVGNGRGGEHHRMPDSIHTRLVQSGLAAGLAQQENADLLCLDGLEAIAGHAEDEEALFHFHNRARAGGGVVLYAARGLTLQERKLDHNEFLDVVLVEPAELMKQIKAGEVSDVKTIIGAFWVGQE